MKIYVNTRSVNDRQLTGVQRYTLEILKVLGSKINSIKPVFPLSGLLGQAWEQFVLPHTTQRNILWSPGNLGPILAQNHVVTVHDVSVLDHPEWFSPNFVRLHTFIQPRLFPRAARIIVDSISTRERLLEHVNVPRERIHVVYCAADRKFKPASRAVITTVNTALRLPTERYILSLSSLEPRKNLGRLIKAWSHVVDQMPQDVWLVIAGGQGAAKVFARDNSSDHLPPRVHFTGYLPDEFLPGLYSGALAFAYPSVYEGFGLPPLEAMACGTPVLTGNLTSLPEVVEDAGLMVNPHDVQEIARVLLRLITDDALRLDLTQRGLKQAAKFSWEKAAAETWAVLESVARGDRV